MWDILMSGWPIWVVVIIAIIICGAELIKAIRVWREEKKNKIDKEVNKVQEKKSLENTLENIDSRLEKIEKRLDTIEEKLQKNEARMEDLTLSDMHDIKSWIVDQHQYFYVDLGWIDAYHMDVIEQRYKDYKKEGGNSYIESLVARLRTLPTDPSLRQWGKGLEKKDDEE